MTTGPSGLVQKDLRTPMGSINAERVIQAIDGAYTNIGAFPVSAATPTVGQVLIFDGTEWAPSAASTGNIANRIVVGTSGDVDYTSVAAAVSAAVAAGASVSNPYMIVVYPGVYTEPQFEVPVGVDVTNSNGALNGLVIIEAANPLDDLVIGSGGTITGLFLRGVTDPGKALVRVSNGGGILTTIQSCYFVDCSIGVAVENGSACSISDCYVRVSAAGEGIETAIWVDGAGTSCLIDRITFSVSAAVVLLYAPANPIETCVSVTGGAAAELTDVHVLVGANSASQAAVFVDESSTLICEVGVFAQSRTAIRIGPNGASQVTLLGCSFENNTINLESLSALAQVFLSITVDATKFVNVAGTTIAGSILNKAEGASNQYLLHGVYDDDAELDVLEELRFESSSAVYSGGALSDGGGLDIDYDAGSGTVRSATSVRDVEWLAGSITLPPNSQRYISYQASTDTIVASAGVPGNTDILLGLVVTGGAAIRYIHKIGWSRADFLRGIRDYFYNTRRVVVRSGMAVSAGSVATRFDVDLGVYYLGGLTQISYAGATDAVFSAFYGADGANELAGQTDVNTADYDNAGVLTAMTAGFYRSDTLYVTSDGKLSLIFGTTEFAVQVDAENELPLAPMTFIEPTALVLASLIVQQGVGIVSFVDHRPFGDSPGGGLGGGGSDHGALSGLSDDDHLQYLLVDGTRAMSGALDMGGQTISNVTTVNGVTVQTHASRHNPGGADALAVSAPVALLVGGAGSVGAAAAYANAEHIHPITRGTPVAVGSANAAGTSANFAGADHVHAPKSGSIIQVVPVELSVDTTTINVPPAYSTLFSQAITVLANSKLKITLTAAHSNTNNGRYAYFRILVDGTPIGRVAGTRADNGIAYGSTTLQVVSGALAAGSRTVTVEWGTSANTAQIRAGTALVAGNASEYANLTIEEIVA